MEMCVCVCLCEPAARVLESWFNYAVLSGQCCHPESQQSCCDDITDNAQSIFITDAQRNERDSDEMRDLQD